MIVTVISPPRSGSSCTAGIVHYLGVPMGNVWVCQKSDILNVTKPLFEDIDWNNLFVTFIHRREDQGLSLIDVPDKIPPATRHEKKMYEVLLNRKKKQLGLPMGYKHPSSIYMMRWVYDIYPDMRYIYVYRDREPVASSLYKAYRDKFGTDMDRYRRSYDGYIRLIEEFKDIVDQPWLDISFNDIVDNPVDAISEIGAFLDLDPSDEDLEMAYNWVDPDMQHWRGDCEGRHWK